MRRSIWLASVAVALMAAAPGLVQAQPEGKGRDRDRGGAERGPPGKGADRDRGERSARGPDREREDRGGRAEPRRERPEARGRDNDAGKWAERRDREGERRAREALRPPGKTADRDRGDRDRGDRDGRDRRYDRDDGRRLVWLRREPDRRMIDGCPPGLAKQNQWCLPPGQLRQIARTRYERPRYDYVWRSYRDEWDYRYGDGYLYRYSPQGSLLGYIPVLGGALSIGSAWPGQYDWQPVPEYYGRYYGLGDSYDYRFSDGVVYGVDPQTQAIQTIAALLTGQDWTVGQQMPTGYDVYNVPYQYRDRYRDGPDRWYRYDDGYVYQVDPNTRLIQTAIQLLA
ncbi:hypothetical protein [Brevundimonas lutea]|uniref:hypothetical protein n=1 Tax=Brevundimonas lutea TaxID=2293980 RepID=UPI000F02D1D6|nr:hypothetical protein [Brevundimonas lutea]